MVQFAAWTGVRAGELHALRWEDVGEDTVWIRRARKRDGTEKPKNGKEREIVLLPPARVLDDLPRRDDPYVFHSPRGESLDQGSQFYAWRVVRASAGLSRIRWHDWRHFCATQLLELGLDHFAVSIQLGHTRRRRAGNGARGASVSRRCETADAGSVRVQWNRNR